MHSRKVLTIILALLVPAVSFAKFVNQDKALQIAQSFFSETGKATRAGATTVSLEMVWPTAAATRAESQPAYYIFNKSDATGFVIVSAETEAPQILAYSDENAFDIGLKDKGADDFLNSYAKAIEGIRGGASAQKTLTFDRNALLYTINWNQGENFFNDKYAPTQYAMPCPAGCGATAMAIVMRYHQWPPKATGKHSYYCESLHQYMSFDYDALTMDWNIPSYPTGTKSDELSKIQKAIGVSMNMKYGANESWCYIRPAAYVMPHYFYYEKPCLMYKSYFTNDEWAQIMINEIDEGRPVLVGGWNSTGAGHFFVLDGYNTQGMFHYNLGWAGLNNGYYHDSFVNYEYAIGEALVGIKPRPLDVEDNISPISYGEADVYPEGNIIAGSPFIVTFRTFTNISNDTLDSRLRIDVCDKDGNYKFTTYENPNQRIGLFPAFMYDSWSFRVVIPKDKTFEPTDQLCISTTDDEGQTWLTVYNTSSAFKKLTLGGYEKDALKISPLAFQTGHGGFTLSTPIITPGQKFSARASYLFNYTNSKIKGLFGMAIVDTTDFSIKYTLKTYEYNLQPDYGWDYYDLTDMVIPENKIKDFKPTYAIMMISKNTGEGAFCPLFNWDLTPKYIPLQSVLEVDLSEVQAVQSSCQDEAAYSIDGRMVDRPSGKGLYLKRSEQGKVEKYYYSE